MPVVTIQARALPTEKKRELVRQITELVCASYGLPAESVIVFIEELPSENIGVAGILNADRK